MQLAQIYTTFLSAKGLCIDSRQVQQGDLFFALGQKDENGQHKGNDFAEMSLQKGALAAIINDAQLKAKYAEDERYILVEDVEICLQQLAQYHRKQIDIPVIAVVGSNGKTTCRQLLYLLLSQNYDCWATPGNFNNHLGLPLSVLQIKDEHELAILEIGANHLGETAALCEIAAPTHGLITNHGKDHLGEYGSLENIQKANHELYDYLAKTGGQAFVYAQDPVMMKAAKQLKNPIFYGRPKDHTQAKVLQAPDLKLEIQLGKRKLPVKMNLFGEFWAPTVLAAATIADYFALPAAVIKQALQSYSPQSLRSERRNWNNQAVLLDCYNANPSSMQVFLQAALAEKSAPKVFVLGEMLELGNFSQNEHQTLLDQLASEKNIQLFLFGPSFLGLSLPPFAQHFEHLDQLQQALPTSAHAIYVKGSRGNRLEQLFEEVKELN